MNGLIMLDDNFFEQMGDVLARTDLSLDQQISMINVSLWLSREQFILKVEEDAPDHLLFIHRLSVAAPALRGEKQTMLTRKGLSAVSAQMTLNYDALSQVYRFQQDVINAQMDARRQGQVTSLHDNWKTIELHVSYQLELAEYLAAETERQRDAMARSTS